MNKSLQIREENKRDGMQVRGVGTVCGCVVKESSEARAIGLRDGGAKEVAGGGIDLEQPSTWEELQVRGSV